MHKGSILSRIGRIQSHRFRDNADSLYLNLPYIENFADWTIPIPTTSPSFSDALDTKDNWDFTLAPDADANCPYNNGAGFLPGNVFATRDVAAPRTNIILNNTPVSYLNSFHKLRFANAGVGHNWNNSDVMMGARLDSSGAGYYVGIVPLFNGTDFRIFKFDGVSTWTQISKNFGTGFSLGEADIWNMLMSITSTESGEAHIEGWLYNEDDSNQILYLHCYDSTYLSPGNIGIISRYYDTNNTYSVVFADYNVWEL